MKSNEFLEEVLRSDICPDNFEKIYSEFRKYQQMAIDTLNEFHRVCEKNKITYQLAYGSLLGAIRDGGQIPWDYDVDVIVPYEEKDQLIDALKKDLSQKYYFYCPEVNPKCRHFFIRVTPKGYRSELLHVDVFYVVGTPEDLIERNRYINQIEEISRIRFGKYVNIIDESKGDVKQALKLTIKKIMALLKMAKADIAQCERLVTPYPAKDAIVGCLLHSEANENCFFSKNIWDSHLIALDTGIFRISDNADAMLRRFYKDYWNISALESRIKEMMKHYYYLEHYGKIKTNE